ncbi:MAG: S-methyl-5'-thioadenosine phosphorylase [Mariprofundaceae bacterium]|nr:S-methyl-5'-thioadenosine phosphorylase [Mariprofundaceae bacterium]
MNKRIGIIGGSGLYDIKGVEILDELQIETPWGKPSDTLTLARFGDQEVIFLPRHGRGHRIPPHAINYRANIYAMKLAAVSQIISVSAVGSLREDIAPGDFVIIDQFVDRTHGRPSTFFEGPLVAHVSMANPVCAALRKRLLAACRSAGISVHDGGCYLTMQGPQFSSRAESELYRSWGMDVIGMTNLPEAKLAREAELCYATVAMCTDYDCWHEEEDDVSVQNLLETMHGNVRKAKSMLTACFDHSTDLHACNSDCRHALEHAILGDFANHDDAAIKPVHALVERLL